MSLKKYTKKKEGMNTTRLSCYRKVMVKKGWKTTLLLLLDLSFAPEIELFTTNFLHQDSLPVFSFLPCVCAFSGPSLLALNFT